MKKFFVVMVVGFFTMTGAAFAQGTATSSIQVLANVADICRITIDASNVDFGTYDPTDESDDIDGSTSVEFRCTKNTTYWPYITGTRTMTSGGNNLTYELYSDAGMTTAWATSKATATPIVSPSNAKQTIPINGKITALQDVPAGAYSENVIVTIEW